MRQCRGQGGKIYGYLYIKGDRQDSQRFSHEVRDTRQSGLIPELTAAVVFEPAYRNPEALRGLEEFSHIWLIWQFSEAVREEWSPHGPASPPGREQAGGGFCQPLTFRPNAIGLSSVQLLRMEKWPGYGEGADCIRGGSYGRNAYF